MASSFFDDPVGFIFGGTTGVTYESLQRRRAIAQALASRRSKFPTNLGEGLTYFGEQIGDILADRRTDAAEKEYTAKEDKVLQGADTVAPTSAAKPAATRAAIDDDDGVTPVTPRSAQAPGFPTPQLPQVAENAITQNVRPDYQPYARQMAQRESAGRPGAVSPTGATGLFQFTRGTGRDYGLVTPGGDTRSDPDANASAFDRLTEANEARLRQTLGRQPTLQELAMAHQQGATGAQRLLAGQSPPARNLAVNRLPSDPAAARARINQFYGFPAGAAPGAAAPQVAGITPQVAGITPQEPTLTPGADQDLRSRIAAAVQLQPPGGAQPTALAPPSGINYGGPTAAAGRPGIVSDAPPPGAVPPMGSPAALGAAGAPDARMAATAALMGQNAPTPSPGAPGPQLAATGPTPVPPVPPPMPPAPQEPIPQVPQLQQQAQAQVPMPRPAPGRPPAPQPQPQPQPIQQQPVPPPPELGARFQTQREFVEPLDMTPPAQTPMTPQELYGQGMLRDRTTFGSPRVQQRAQQLISEGAARRKFIDEQNAKRFEHTLQMRKQREELLEGRPKRDAETAETIAKTAKTDLESLQLADRIDLTQKLGGQNPEEFFKWFEEERKGAQTAARSLSDNQLILKAINDGIITGWGSKFRLDTHKFAAWALQNGLSGDLASNTEMMQTASLNAISNSIRMLNPSGGPATNVDTWLAQNASGTNPGLEAKTIERTIRRANALQARQIDDFESNRDHFLGGTRAEPRYRLTAPDIMPQEYAQALLADPSPANKLRIDRTFGDGAADLVLSRAARAERRRQQQQQGGR